MNRIGPQSPRAVIVISSHVARGSVGNRAAVFALETLGHPVWAVPTVTLPWHPGHGPATRIVPETKQFGALLRDLENAPWLGEVAAVLSGYLGDAGQAAAVASLVRRVKKRNGRALYVCDPVMGDEAGLYVPEEIAAALRDVLMPLADIATPNRFELQWIAGRPLDDMEATIAAASAAGPRTMLVTSVRGHAAGSLGNLLVTPEETLLAEHDAIAQPPNGLGDLTAALYLARRLGGMAPEEALRSTTASVYEILSRATRRGADELMLETDAGGLSTPETDVVLRRLGQSSGPVRA